MRPDSKCLRLLPKGDTYMKRWGIGFLTALAIATAFSRSPSEAKERINIIYPSVSGLVLGLWVTQEAGLFGKHGLEANLVYIQSASAVMQAMLGGEAPIALSGGKPVVDLGLEGGDPVFVAGI